jgi:hypothetical protein
MKICFGPSTDLVEVVDLAEVVDAKLVLSARLILSFASEKRFDKFYNAMQTFIIEKHAQSTLQFKVHCYRKHVRLSVGNTHEICETHIYC